MADTIGATVAPSESLVQGTAAITAQSPRRISMYPSDRWNRYKRESKTCRWSRRAAGFILSLAVTFTGLSALTAPVASAGSCNGPACGRVWNWTNSTMRVASLEAKSPDRCTVRTWPGKEKFTDYKNDGKAACKIVRIKSGGYSGSKLKDTDAFTFHRKFSLGGQAYSAGTYVKINNFAQVTCTNPFDTMPRCKFLGT
ncbi:MAG: hypothetical protein M3R63_06610 [Actinomycetota bacterium]|nr:hypothetical protein [Actinomycetota bacterium]